MNDSQLIVVLGMHRSGTSAITRGLVALGVDLGLRLRPALANANDKGFFEDIDVNALNDDLLHALGLEWHTPLPIDDGAWSKPQIRGYERRAAELLRSKLRSTALFGFKDPRLPRVLPFWRKIFEELQVPVRYVIACRNPLSVCHSLAKRDGFDRARGLILWFEHSLASLTCTAGAQRVVVEYDRVLADPRHEIARVSARLGLPFDPRSRELDEYATGFLTPLLRHARHSVDDLASDERVPAAVVRLFRTLDDLAADRTAPDSPALHALLAQLEAERAEVYAKLEPARPGRAAPSPRDRLAGEPDAGEVQRTLATLGRRCYRRALWKMTFRAFAAYRLARKLLGIRQHVPLPDYDQALEVPFLWLPAPFATAPRIAVVCHLYFDQMAAEFRYYFANIPFACDLYITTDTAAKKQRIESAFSAWDKGRVEVRLTQNRGRDIAPKLIACADVYDRYEYVLHVHSKRSSHLPHLGGWRKYLLDTLVGSPQIVASIFGIFSSQPNVGMIAAQHYEGIRPGLGWGKNFRLAEAFTLRAGLELDLDQALDFPSGSMFWARSAALRPILRAGLKLEEFPPEANQTDGTLAHAIERLYFYACKSAGLEWIKIACADLMRGSEDRITTAHGPQDVAAFVDATRVGSNAQRHAPGRGRSRHHLTLQGSATIKLLRRAHENSQCFRLGFADFVGAVSALARGKPGLIDFDENHYLLCNPDVEEAVDRGYIPCGFIHYCTAGMAEGRAWRAGVGDSDGAETAPRLAP